MSNPLTGDFEAVLQVSGGTINRLLASMHQNAFEKPKFPSFPHSVRMRIGDDHAFEGVRGLAHAQVSVPRVELIHGATDRFILEVGVRAWYRPDPGTEPMAAFINGTVRAEYRVQDIDRACLGWSKKSRDFLWIRVVRDSVLFRGTAEDDSSIFEIIPTLGSGGADTNPAANVAKVTRQIARLLATRFEATPHKVEKGFRRGSLRSLNAPIGGSAVALPLSLSDTEPSGDIHSIDTVLLSGSDLAISVSIGYIMTLVNPLLEDVKTFSRTIPVGAAGVSTVYRVGVHPTSIQWLPHGSYADFKIKVSGWATTDSILPNATFSVEQDVHLNFNGTLRLSPGSLIVTASSSSQFVRTLVLMRVQAEVKTLVQAACDEAQSYLDKMTQQTAELSTQLKTLDEQATVWLDSAEFVKYGLVIRGTIYVTPRRGLVRKTDKTVAEDAHSALESWIPGGRIDRFEWTWSWFGPGQPGTATFHDRFLLRRPAVKVGRWGMSVGGTPLPGLDGWGLICLKITGARVDSVTGEWVSVISTKRCTRFGYDFPDVVTQGGRLFLRDMPELSQDVPFPQLNALPLVSTRRGAVGRANTLLLYVDASWDEETASTLKDGLGACGRYDAGLSVLVLFREGILEANGHRLIVDVESYLRKLGIPGHVNEDVNGDWSRTLDLHAGSGEPGWAIISPEGTTPWKHQGRMPSHELASALDTHLRQCPDLRPGAYNPGVAVGTHVSATALHPALGDLLDMEESHCPPIPLGRLGRGTVVTFVQKDSPASINHLRTLAVPYAQQEDEQGSAVVVVIDGADRREADSFKNQHGLDVVAIADPSGAITDRFRVGVWPTTIELDPDGVVSDVQIGIAQRPRYLSDPPDEEYPEKGEAVSTFRSISPSANAPIPIGPGEEHSNKGDAAP